MGSRKFEVGQRVRVKKGYQFNDYGNPSYGDPTGLEGVVLGYQGPPFPVNVEIEPTPDGTPDAVRYHYDELFSEWELEAVE